TAVSATVAWGWGRRPTAAPPGGPAGRPPRRRPPPAGAARRRSGGRRTWRSLPVDRQADHGETLIVTAAARGGAPGFGGTRSPACPLARTRRAACPTEDHSRAGATEKTTSWPRESAEVSSRGAIRKR